MRPQRSIDGAYEGVEKDRSSSLPIDAAKFDRRQAEAEGTSMVFERILVPVDGSGVSGKALEFAIERAKLHNSKITVAFAVNRLSVATATAAPYAYVDATPMLEALEAEAEAVLGSAESAVRAAGVASTRVKLDGPAGRAILTYARETNPDVIVMGTRGRRGFERLAIGSTAEEVVRASAVPVFVIPLRAVAAAQPGPLQHVLVAIDGSPAADDGLAFACDLAQREHARLTLCTVAEAAGMDWDGVDRDMFLEAEIEERARPLLERSRIRASSLGIDVNTDLRQGNAAAEIVASAQQAKADIIVVGTHGRAGIPRFILGSVAEGVLRTSTLPVCTVRDR
jgi:nucleotide-binding universal stress UspA family protein